MDPTSAKRTQFTIFGGYVVLVLMLAFLPSLMPKHSRAFAAEPVFLGISVLSLLGCAYWSFTKLQAAPIGDVTERPPIARFQANMLVALAFAELPALLGFVVATASGTLPIHFFGLALLGEIGFVLPRLLAFWRSAG